MLGEQYVLTCQYNYCECIISYGSILKCNCSLVASRRVYCQQQHVFIQILGNSYTWINYWTIICKLNEKNKEMIHAGEYLAQNKKIIKGMEEGSPQKVRTPSKEKKDIYV